MIAVDVGGTFTDCVAWSPKGLEVAKVATSEDQSEAVVEGSTRLLPGPRASALLHGSTVATNALLERKGADTVLVTDEGFEDVIEIGRQDRPSLYDSFSDRSQPLVARSDRRGVDSDLAELIDWCVDRAPESVAVSLAYSFRDSTREREIGAALASLGVPVSLSHRVVGEFREFERTSTTVLNAYLWPRVAGYLGRLASRACDLADRVQVMRSSGGLMDVEEASRLAAALLLSGPAGGVVAATGLAQARELDRAVAFDMGGTSTDVCRIEAGAPEISYERSIDGYVCRMPSVAVHTVGAGGGSLAWRDPGGALRVGPMSAGAFPGPAAYGAGGTGATVTDAHVALARIDPGARLGGTLQLDPEAAQAALAAIGDLLGLTSGAAAEGMIEVVEAHMERAIRAVSVEQGADPRQAVLVAFGGAGGLHATALARRLGMKGVAIPPYVGVFSALGLLMAPPRLDGARSFLLTDGDGFAEAVDSVASSTGGEFRSTHGRDPTTVTSKLDMRYRGQAHELAVPVERGDTFQAAAERFHRIHHEVNGFSRPSDPVEAVTVRAVAEGRPLLTWDDLPTLPESEPPDTGQRKVVMEGREVDAGVWWRPQLGAGCVIEGPAVVEEETGTTILLPGDTGLVGSDGTIEVTW